MELMSIKQKLFIQSLISKKKIEDTTMLFDFNDYMTKREASKLISELLELPDKTDGEKKESALRNKLYYLICHKKSKKNEVILHEIEEVLKKKLTKLTPNNLSVEELSKIEELLGD